MKQLIFILFFMWAFLACSDKPEIGPISSSIGQITDVFELKYGEVKKYNYDGQVFKFSITDIEDNRMPCHLMYFADDPEGFNKIGLHTYLRVEIGNKAYKLKVSSKFCTGTLEYNNSDAVQQIWNELKRWEIDSIISSNSNYFEDAFTLAYAGALIENTPFSIYMASAKPPINGWEDLKSEIEKNQYEFIFIITKNT